MQSTRHQPIELQVIQLENKTWIAFLLKSGNKTTEKESDPYDDTGALYYVIAVVLIYGFSIILMIGSFIKKSRQDHGLSKYMEDMDMVRQLEKRQAKFKTRLAMHNNRKGTKVCVNVLYGKYIVFQEWIIMQLEISCDFVKVKKPFGIEPRPVRLSAQFFIPALLKCQKLIVVCIDSIVIVTRHNFVWSETEDYDVIILRGNITKKISQCY